MQQSEKKTKSSLCAVKTPPRSLLKKVTGKPPFNHPAVKDFLQKQDDVINKCLGVIDKKTATIASQQKTICELITGGQPKHLSVALKKINLNQLNQLR